MNAVERYETWRNAAALDARTRAELDSVAGDIKQIEDRFARDLEFGTGGLRGVLGAGTNRMNAYTVRRAAAGFAQALLSQRPDAGDMGVAIAYDSRRFSREFALDTALVMAKYGVRAYLFDSLRPTPELSFAVKHLGCAGGVVITASHNPKEYNGFKAYGADGGQITPETADEVIKYINALDPLSITPLSEDEARGAGLLKFISDEIDDKYIEHVLSLRPDPGLLKRTGVKLSIVYTPLHGSGNLPVRRALERAGFDDVTVVSEQEAPNGEFPTVLSPNPENPEAFELAIKYADKLGADIIIGTDPDSDRMGMMILSGGKWTPVTGNQAGCLMLEYILRARSPAPGTGAYAVTTIVSTRMVDAIASKFGVDVKRVLTGFKFIGETIDDMEKAGNHGFLLGFEESYGYLTGGYIRDKDAVIAALLACEMAAYFKSVGMTVFDALDDMFSEYGYYAEKTISITMPGMDGIAKRERAMRQLRQSPPKRMGGRAITEAHDFAPGGVMGLPKADVLLYALEGDAWVCVRPSGTEPKLKIYAGVRERSRSSAKEALSVIMNDAAGLGG